MNFEDRLKMYEYKLNDTDDQIADFIKANKERFIKMPIGKFSNELFTSPNTVVRFCKKLGYSGFSELKANIKLINNNSSIKISENIIKTYELIDNELFYKVSKKINEAKTVVFFGVGDSKYFAEMTANYLSCVGINTKVISQRHDMILYAKSNRSKEILFVISLSGETKQVLEATKIARENNNFIISLTHLYKNSISEIADLNLFCWSPLVDLNGYNVTDRTSAMIILRKLCEFIWVTSNS